MSQLLYVNIIKRKDVKRIEWVDGRGYFIFKLVFIKEEWIIE